MVHIRELNDFCIKTVYAALTKETLPERAWILVEGAQDRCEALHQHGVQRSTDLFKLVDEGRVDDLVRTTGIEKAYVIRLYNVLMFHRFKPTLLTKLEVPRREHAESVRDAGIKNTGKLLLECETPEGTLDLARRASIPEDDLYRILTMADLMRKAAVKATKTRLFMAAGIRSLRMLGAQSPVEFRNTLRDIIADTGIVKAVPTPKEVASDIAWAKLHPVVVAGL